MSTHRASDADTVVLVCRDCCCGTVRKHPDVDHDRHLERLADAVRQMGGAKLLVTRCLDVCSHSNVVVIRSRIGPRKGTLWFGEVLSNKRLEALCTWLRAGGSRSAAPLPATLAFATFAPSESSMRCVIREERSPG